MAISLPQDLLDIVGKLSDTVRTGFQRSHVIGSAFAKREMQWLKTAIGFDVDDDYNLKPRPETLRGSAAIQAAAHSGPHIEQIDTLKYDVNDTNSRKFLNVIERKQRTELLNARLNGATAAEIDDIKLKYRVEVKNAVDFWATLELHQDALDQMGFNDLRSVAFNGADPRTVGDNDALRTYLNQNQVSRLFDYDYMKAHPYFQEIESLRTGQGGIPLDIDIDRELIDRYAVQGYIRYPNGEVIWSDDMRAEALARSSALGQFANAKGDFGPDEFDRFEEEVDKPLFRDFVTKVKGLLVQIRQSGVDGDTKTYSSLKQLERDFHTAFRGSSEKMAFYADYAETRARLVLDAMRGAGDRIPAYLRAGVAKADEYFRDGATGRVDKVRVGAGLATGVLAVANLWVELDRIDYDENKVPGLIANAACEAVESLPIAGAIALAGLTPFGPAANDDDACRDAPLHERQGPVMKSQIGMRREAA